VRPRCFLVPRARGRQGPTANQADPDEMKEPSGFCRSVSRDFKPSGQFKGGSACARHLPDHVARPRRPPHAVLRDSRGVRAHWASSYYSACRGRVDWNPRSPASVTPRSPRDARPRSTPGDRGRSTRGWPVDSRRGGPNRKHAAYSRGGRRFLSTESANDPPEITPMSNIGPSGRSMVAG